MAKTEEIEPVEVEAAVEPAEDPPAAAAPPDEPAAGDAEVAAEEPKPRGKTSWLTIALILCNFLAILGFAFVLYLDIGKRQSWARAVLMRDLAIIGVPLDNRELGYNPEAGAQPPHYLDPPLLRDAYKARGGKLSDKFMEVNENFKIDIRAADLDQSILARYFSDAGAGTPVATQKDEVLRLKNSLPNELNAVAQGVADKAKGKTADDKRTLLRHLLFAICSEGWQVNGVEDRIQKTPDSKLDEFVAAAAKRRMWFDILQPLEVFRPSAKVDAGEGDKAPEDPKAKSLLVDRAAELDDVSVQQLAEFFGKRCDQVLADVDWINPGIKRDDFEKRRSIAFLLLTVSQVEIPGIDRSGAPPAEDKKPKAEPKAAEKAEDKGLVHFVQEAKQEDEKKPGDQPEQKPRKERPARSFAFANAERRAEAISGLRDFDQACEDLAIVNEILQQQTMAAIHRDLGNYRYPVEPDADAKLNANAIGFLGNYNLALKRVHDLGLLVQTRERQLMEMHGVFEGRKKHLDNRLAYEQDSIKKLLQARTETRLMALDLKALQDSLFQAQSNLRAAHEYVLYLAQRLQEVERKLSKSKGGPGQ